MSSAEVSIIKILNRAYDTFKIPNFHFAREEHRKIDFGEKSKKKRNNAKVINAKTHATSNKSI